MNAQQNIFKKRKITLSILSRVSKAKGFPRDRNSMLSYINEDRAKINNRYADVASEVLMKSQDEQVNSSQQRHQKRQQTNGDLQASGQIEGKQSSSLKRSRFLSVQRPKQSQSISRSPYKSEERKRNDEDRRGRIKTEPQIDLQPYNKKVVDLVRKRLDRSTQRKVNSETRKVKETVQNADKIFKHFQNFLRVAKHLKSNRAEFQVIAAIKQYVLEEVGDSSQIEEVYESPEIVKCCKRILFHQKMFIMVLVDLIIARKFRMIQSTVKSISNNLLHFYATVYHDIKSQVEVFPTVEMQSLEAETLQWLQGQGQGRQGKVDNDKQIREDKRQFVSLSFTLAQESIGSKIKSCFKFCKNLEHFYKFHNPHIESFSSNLSYFRLLEFYSLCLLGVDWKPWKVQFLETCPSPYLHYEAPKKYTLVLDLDETLIHYKVKNMQGQFLIRPHMFEFLQEMSQHFEIGVFTCSMPEYADIILNHMKHVTFRLYRHHTIRLNEEYVKDLERIGRDIKTVLLVDNLQRNFRLQKRNGIHVRSWYGDKKDGVLKKLAAELKMVASSECDDLRELEFLRSFL